MIAHLSVNANVDHLFNYKLFTAEVKDLSMLQNRFLFQDMVIYELPREMMGELLMVLSGD